MLFLGGMMFSLVLYLGSQIPWFLSAIGGVFSSLFLFSLGIYWIGANPYPEMGWLFILWGTANIIISFVVVIGAFQAPSEPPTGFE
jgi:hypothetical protein